MAPTLTAEGNKVNIDKALSLVGEYKKYHVMLLVMFCLIIVSPGMQMLIVYFIAHNPEWQCVQNSTYCTLSGTVAENSPKYRDRCNMPRNAWEFTEIDDYSIVTQFELCCGRENFVYLETSLTFLGWAIGAISLGYLSDRFGRHKILFASFGFTLVCSFVCAFSSIFEILVFIRFLVGFFSSGAFIQTFILALELTTPKYRAMTAMILWMSFTLSLALMGALASFIPNWKTLLIVTSVPFVPFLSFAKFVPESIRWMRLNNKIEDAVLVLQKMAATNSMEENFAGIKLMPVDEDSTNRNSRNDILRTFKNKEMLKSIVIQAYIWMVMAIAYYLVFISAGDLGLGLHKGFIVAAICELPVVPLVIYLLKRFGRKKTVMFGMCISALCIISSSFVPQESLDKDLINVRMALGMTGRVAVAVAVYSIYIWSFELQPTVTRSQGVGFVQFFGRVGASSAPWIIIGLQKGSLIIPLSLMGGAVVLGAVLCLFLKETKLKSTAEIIEDIEKDTPLTAFIDKHKPARSRRWSLARPRTLREIVTNEV